MYSATWIFSWVISGSVLKNALVPWGLTRICGSELNFSEPLGTSLIVSVCAPYKQGCKLNATSFSSGKKKKPFQNKAKPDCSPFLHLDSAFLPSLLFFLFLFYLYSDCNLKYWDVSRPHHKIHWSLECPVVAPPKCSGTSGLTSKCCGAASPWQQWHRAS